MESKYAIFTLLRGETTDEVYVDHSADGILALMLAEVQPGTDSEYNYEFKLLPIGWIS